MKVQCDRFIGWMIDVPIGLYNQNIREYYKKYCDLTSLTELYVWCKDSSAKVLLENGFIGSDYLYDYDKDSDNQITLLIDSNNDYIKLIYIVELTRNYEDLFVGDNDDNKILNQYLKQIPVPEVVCNQIERIYQELFKTDNIYPIHLQEFYHWNNKG